MENDLLLQTMNHTFKDKDVKIRKEQRCYSCWRKLPRGTVMNYCVWTYEGDFGAVYCCMTCQAIMRYQEPDDDGGYPQLFVRNQLAEGQTPEDLLLELNEKTHK